MSRFAEVQLDGRADRRMVDSIVQQIDDRLGEKHAVAHDEDVDGNAPDQAAVAIEENWCVAFGHARG